MTACSSLLLWAGLSYSGFSEPCPGCSWIFLKMEVALSLLDAWSLSEIFLSCAGLKIPLLWPLPYPFLWLWAEGYWGRPGAEVWQGWNEHRSHHTAPALMAHLEVSRPSPFKGRCQTFTDESYCFRHSPLATYYRLAQIMRKDFNVSIRKAKTMQYSYPVLSPSHILTISSALQHQGSQDRSTCQERIFSCIWIDLVFNFIAIPFLPPPFLSPACAWDRKGQMTLLPSLRSSQPRRELSLVLSLQLPWIRGSALALQPSLIALQHKWDLPRGQSQHLEARNHVSHPKLLVPIPEPGLSGK